MYGTPLQEEFSAGRKYLSSCSASSSYHLCVVYQTAKIFKIMVRIIVSLVGGVRKSVCFSRRGGGNLDPGGEGWDYRMYVSMHMDIGRTQSS